MKTKQSSLSYSESDSAVLQLTPSIQNVIAPNTKGSVEVKFDGYGTLHVLERGDDGALLKDSCLVKNDEEEYNVKEEYTSQDRLESLMNKNMWLSRAVKLQRVLIVAFVIAFILFCLLLKITLQRYM